MVPFLRKPATRKNKWPLQRELMALVYWSIAFFVGISLFSYNPYDRTFLYFDTLQKPITNWCGIIGAQCAALLLYLLGAGSYALILFFLFLCYFSVTKKSIAQEWDRIAGYCLLILSVSSLCSLLQFDWYAQCVPGGYCGYALTGLLHRWSDTLGAFLFLSTALCASVTLISRISFFTGLKYIIMHILVPAGKLLWIPAHVFRHSISFTGEAIKSWCGFSTTQEISFDGGFYDAEANRFTDSLWQKSPLEKSLDQEFAMPVMPVIQTPSAKKHAPMPAPSVDSEPFCGEESAYQLPHLDVFIGVDEEQHDQALMQELEKRAVLLQEKLERFDVYGKVTAIKRGPVITLFEYQPHIDTKISKIIALEDDLALALQAVSIRIIAPIPGRSVVGFEVANKQRRNVLLSQLIKSEPYLETKATLPMIVGVDTIGATIIIDLCKMPHLLMAGSTGSGKSVSLNAMLISLLCKTSPDDLRLVLIDPKRLEFAPYADIAHLLFPIVTDPKQAPAVLRWVVKQMEERYELMAKAGARNISDYRAKQEQAGGAKLPFIVVIIDELADLMMCAGKEVEDAIIRITQMARAAGIHMIAATQRPSVDVITGLIKVNFPSRISFRVTSKIDSRTILDTGGADKLLGRGDMLFLDAGDAVLKRLHGAYVLDQEINKVIAHIRAQRAPDYLDLKQVCSQEAIADPEDQMFDEVCNYLQEIEEVSISLLQRRFRIGYNRSARIIEALEAKGMIAPAYGGKTRKVIR